MSGYTREYLTEFDRRLERVERRQRKQEQQLSVIAPRTLLYFGGCMLLLNVAVSFLVSVIVTRIL